MHRSLPQYIHVLGIKFHGHTGAGEHGHIHHGRGRADSAFHIGTVCLDLFGNNATGHGIGFQGDIDSHIEIGGADTGSQTGIGLHHGAHCFHTLYLADPLQQVIGQGACLLHIRILGHGNRNRDHGRIHTGHKDETLGKAQSRATYQPGSAQWA